MASHTGNGCCGAALSALYSHLEEPQRLVKAAGEHEAIGGVELDALYHGLLIPGAKKAC